MKNSKLSGSYCITAQKDKGELSEVASITDVSTPLCECEMLQCFSHRDVCLVDIMLATAFSDEKHTIKKEERPLVFCSMDFEGSL